MANKFNQILFFSTNFFSVKIQAKMALKIYFLQMEDGKNSDSLEKYYSPMAALADWRLGSDTEELRDGKIVVTGFSR